MSKFAQLTFAAPALGALLFLSSAAYAERQPARVSDGTLVSADGTPLRGLRYSLDLHGDEPDPGLIEALPSLGCNVLHVYAEKHSPMNEAGYNEVELNKIVDRTAASDLYLVITIGAPPDMPPDLDFAREFWQYYAGRLANRKHVIFEIQNEPWHESMMAQPSPPDVQELQADVYRQINRDAPDVPILLYSYAFFHSYEGVLQDINDLRLRLLGNGQTRGTQIDWTKTAIAFHGYSDAEETKETIDMVTDAGYPVMETELGVTPTDPALDFDLIDVYESTRTSWISFLPLKGFNAAHWMGQFDAESVIWAADSGVWPGSSNPPVGETVALRSSVNGKYVRVDASSEDELKAEADSVTTEAQFVVVPFVSERYVALQAVSNGRYVLISDSDSHLFASSPVPKRLEWIDRPAGSVTLQAESNWRFVSADFNLVPPPLPQTPPLVADRLRGGNTWEEFDVDVLSTLAVTLAGPGSGSVTSVPAGIDCGNDCSEVYPHNTSVALNAQAAGGSTFSGWSGAGCGGVVVMSGHRNCTATFTLDAPTAPVIDFAGTDTSTWQASEGSHHGVTVQVTDPQGIQQVRAWINRNGSNAGNHRGLVSWKHDTYLWPWAVEKMACSGGGWASKSTNPATGGEHIELLGCTTSVAGSQRTVTFSVRALPSFGTFGPINDIAAFARDLSGEVQPFVNFDSNFSSSTVDATAPVLVSVDSGGNTWNIGGSSEYHITMRVVDAGGLDQARAWINRLGSNSGNRRGEISWKLDSYLWPWAVEKMACSGGGWASKSTHPTSGGEHIELLGCTTSITGNQRTVTFRVRPQPSFGVFGPINDIAAFARDLSGNTRTYTNFNTNFQTTN